MHHSVNNCNHIMLVIELDVLHWNFLQAVGGVDASTTQPVHFSTPEKDWPSSSSGLSFILTSPEPTPDQPKTSRRSLSGKYLALPVVRDSPAVIVSIYIFPYFLILLTLLSLFSLLTFSLLISGIFKRYHIKCHVKSYVTFLWLNIYCIPLFWFFNSQMRQTQRCI